MSMTIDDMIHSARNTTAQYLEELEKGNLYSLQEFQALIESIYHELESLPEAERSKYKDDMLAIQEEVRVIESKVQEQFANKRTQIGQLSGQAQAAAAYRTSPGYKGD